MYRCEGVRPPLFIRRHAKDKAGMRIPHKILWVFVGDALSPEHHCGLVYCERCWDGYDPPGDFLAWERPTRRISKPLVVRLAPFGHSGFQIRLAKGGSG